MDRLTFGNFLTRAMAGDDTVPATILNRINAALRGRGIDPKDAEAQRWRDFFWRQVLDQTHRAIDDLIGRYNEMADWHREQAELARGRMREAADKLAEIDKFVTGADDILNEKERTGKFDRAKAVAMLKQRGIAVGPDEDDQSILNKLTEERRKALEQRREWSRRYDQANEDATRHDDLERENRRKAKELMEKRDAIRSGGYGPEEEALRLRQVANEYKLDVQQRAVEMERERKAAESPADQAPAVQKGIDDSQTQNEESDFLASVDDLTGKFAVAAAKAPQEEGLTHDAPHVRKLGTTGPAVSA